jgi:hypothetical protein
MVHKVIFEDGDADFRVLWNVDEYYGGKRETIKFTVVVQEARLDGASG